MIKDFLIMAFKNLKKRRLRSFLTLVGILISIATIFVLISVSLGLEDTIQEEFEKLGSDKFFIQPRGQFGPPGAATAAELTIADAEVIKKVAGVKDISYWVMGNAEIKFNNEKRFIMILGVEPETMRIAFGSYDLEEGRFLKEGDGNVILIGSQYKHDNYLKKPVELGDAILINGIKFKVVGIVEEIGSPQDDRQIYMPDSAFRELFNITDRIDFFVVQINEGENMKEVSDRTEKKLMHYRNIDENTIDFTILTPEELLESIGNILTMIKVFLVGIALISLVVGGINIANTMFTSVLERTKEIGLMKSVGAKNLDIMAIFLIEAGLLGAIGGFAGVLAGFGISKIIEFAAATQLGTSLLKTSTPFYLFAGCIMFAFIAGAVSGVLPAYRASRLHPVDALRYE